MSDDADRTAAIRYLDDNNVTTEIEHLVAATGYRVSRRFKDYVSADDIRQQLHEWVLKAPKKIARWHQDNDENGFQRLLGSVLYDEATHFGRKSKAGALGYKLGDEFYYTRAMLTGSGDHPGLLVHVYNHDAWSNPPQQYTGGRSGKALNEGFGWQATLADVSRALSRIPKVDQDVLRLTYAEKVGRKRYAKAHDVSLSTAYARHDQALKHLWQELGGPKWLSRSEDRRPDAEDDHEGKWRGGRHALSNAQARSLTDSEAAHTRHTQQEW